MTVRLGQTPDHIRLARLRAKGWTRESMRVWSKARGEWIDPPRLPRAPVIDLFTRQQIED